MRKIIKRIASFFLIPATRWYLRKDRRYTYKQVTVEVPQGVFHPGLFYSTKFLLDFLLKQNLKEKSLLEIGGGSGLIAIHCAQQGTHVTVTDLSKKAIAAIQHNSILNVVAPKIILSDVFQNVPLQPFDWIVINPPYYAREPKNEAELAWHCGKDFDYFQKLFKGLGGYIHHNTKVIMVLTLGCELDKIFSMAKHYGFELNTIAERAVLFDGKDFLFEIKPKSVV